MRGSNFKVILGVSFFSLALGAISLALMPDPPAEIVARAMAQPGIPIGNTQILRPDVRVIPLPEQQRQAAVAAQEPRPQAQRKIEVMALKPVPLADSEKPTVIEKPILADKPAVQTADPQPKQDAKSETKPETRPEAKPETKTKPAVRRVAGPSRERPVREASAKGDGLSFYPYER